MLRWQDAQCGELEATPKCFPDRNVGAAPLIVLILQASMRDIDVADARPRSDAGPGNLKVADYSFSSIIMCIVSWLPAA
jgi:hypothetical protein